MRRMVGEERGGEEGGNDKGERREKGEIKRGARERR